MTTNKDTPVAKGLQKSLKMALRIRENGDILCAAKTNAEEGDTYIHDGIHYYLSVMTEAIVASRNHKKDNLWFWNIKPEMQEHSEEIKAYQNR